MFFSASWPPPSVVLGCPPNRGNIKMDAFVISSVPSRLKETYKQQGPLAPWALPHFLATTDPTATLSPSTDFPVEPVIRSTLLRRFRTGTSRASPVTRRVLVTVLSLPPRRGEDAASVRFRHSMLPSPLRCGLGPRVKHFRGHIYVHCRYGPVTRNPPKGDLVDRLQDFGFPRSCYPNYRAPDFCPGRCTSC